MTLKGQDRAAYLRALPHLEPLGVAVETASVEYADARKRLGGIPLARAVEYYLQHHQITPRLVAYVIAECLTAKKSDGLSDVYLASLRTHFKEFPEAFPCNIGDIPGAEIDRWLRTLGIGPSSRNNHRESLKTLFGFAKARKDLHKDQDEIDAVTLAKQNSGDIEIFEPAELRLIFKRASSALISFLALGAFAGIRHAEILRLEWKDIRFADGIIEIRPAKAKTASRRTIPMLDSLKAWLEPFRHSNGHVYRGAGSSNDIVHLVREIQRKAKPNSNVAKFAWKNNGLRHSFISYRVSQTQNVAQVALEAGNSPQIIFRNYRELVTPAAAKEWFEIKPEV